MMRRIDGAAIGVARAGNLVRMTESVHVPVPTIRQVVLDCPDARALAEFYRELFGLRYRPG